MKTAISIPDATYQRVTRRAAGLGGSRSEFFARYLDELNRESLTDQIDAAIIAQDGAADDSADVVEVGRRQPTDASSP